MAFSGLRSLPLRWLRRCSTSIVCKSSIPNFRHPIIMQRSAFSSADSANINVTIDGSSGVAVLEMKKKPVNSLNLEMLTELNLTLEKLENEQQVNGLIITSSQPKIFSAGLDILEMYDPKKERVFEFWRSLQNFWMRLYLSRLATAAAINGNSPAGGCLIALSCDYRVMASGNYRIGLNETLLGIVAPFWFMDSIKNVIGQRESERALQLGTLFTSDYALKIGLVDDVVPELSVVQHAKDEISKWLKVPAYARQLTKQALRKPTVDKLMSRQNEDIENFINFVTKDSIQKGLAKYLESLKRKN